MFLPPSNLLEMRYDEMAGADVMCHCHENLVTGCQGRVTIFGHLGSLITLSLGDFGTRREQKKGGRLVR